MSITEIPKRSSLVSQVVEILRRELQRGSWGKHLPPEGELCAQFQVSRITLRSALDVLRRQGLIEVSQGKRTRIKSAGARVLPLGPTKTVAVVSQMPYHALSSFALFQISELQARLHDVGYRLEVHSHSRFASRNASKAWAELVAQTRADCWVLFGGDSRIEHWFADREMPAVVVGSPQSGVALPYVGADYRAICRHAAGMLQARGHSRQALVIPHGDFDGKDPFVMGFSEALPATLGHDRPSKVVYHDGTVKGIATSLRPLFRSPLPPSGLLVARPKYTLTVMTHLAGMGINIPRDVSLISLGYEKFLDSVTPSVAHYEINWMRFAMRLLRMILRRCDPASPPSRSVSMMADFHDGESLAGPQ